MVQSKDASFKFISKKHLKVLFEIFGIQFGRDLDFSDVEVLTTEEIAIEPALLRPDYVVKLDNIIFMMEFESSYVGTQKKKLFKLYVAAYDYKNNDENNKIIFFVISTKEKSKMASYKINDWDSFNFPIISLKDLDKDKIINNVETKIENNGEFSDRELIEFSLTPIMEDNREKITEQFYKTKDLLNQIEFPTEEIKTSSYGIVLMLSSMFFDELDEFRKDLQGDLMGKVDCVQEACRESYEAGRSKGLSDGARDASINFARNLLVNTGLSDEEISKNTGLPLEKIRELRAGTDIN